MNTIYFLIQYHIVDPMYIMELNFDSFILFSLYGKYKNMIIYIMVKTACRKKINKKVIRQFILFQ